MKIKNKIAIIAAFSTIFGLQGSALANTGVAKTNTPIELYMEHKTNAQKVKRQTELRLMDNKKALAEIDTLNIERKAEYDALRHKRDMQTIQLEIKQQRADIEILKVNIQASEIIATAKSIMDDALAQQKVLEELRTEFDADVANKETDLDALKLAQLKLVKDQELLVKNQTEFKTQLTQLQEDKTAQSEKAQELEVLLVSNQKQKTELRKQLDEIGVSLEYQENQERIVATQQQTIYDLETKLSALDNEINLRQEEDALSTSYELVYTNGVEAMVRYGNNERIVRKGSKIDGLTVKDLDKESVTLGTKSGLIKRISIAYSPY